MARQLTGELEGPPRLADWLSAGQPTWSLGPESRAAVASTAACTPGYGPSASSSGGSSGVDRLLRFCWVAPAADDSSFVTTAACRGGSWWLAGIGSSRTWLALRDGGTS